MKFIIIISVLLMSCSMKLNKNNHNLNNYKMKKFKIEEFKNLNLKINEKHSLIKNDTIIELAEYENHFIKYTKTINSAFQKREVFNKLNFLILGEEDYFHMFPIGVSKKYDFNGILIETKNNDEKYPFSVNQLIDKMKTVYNIDITNTNNIGVGRRYEMNVYIYNVIIPTQDPISSVREIIIDGSNGNIISDKINVLNKH
jgi:hypothetical protein